MPDQPKAQAAPPYPPNYYMRQRRSNWWIPVLIIAIVLLMIIVFFFALFGSIASSFEDETVEVKENSVLYLKFGAGVEEYNKPMPFAGLFGQPEKTSFRDLIHSIKAAKDDDRIKGIYYEAGMGGMGYAKAMEFLDEMDEFKNSGKFVYSYIKMGGENQYLYALPSDSIFMPREGFLEMNGFGASSMFLKGFFDKIGIDYYVVNFEDYKSAAESYSRKDFSDSSRVQYNDLLQQRYRIFTEKIAKYRGLSKDEIDSALNLGMYMPDKLKDHGFIDAYLTSAQVKDLMKEKIYGKEKAKDKESKLRLITPAKYMRSDIPVTGTVAEKDKQIAIVYGLGVIRDFADDSPFNDEHAITPKEFVKSLKLARENEDVKVIILRIDSPGGSVIASEEIWQEIIETRKVKPVYASMSDVAASGGYYIPIACDTIIASPTTITGSIGVIAAIPNFSGLLGKLDITADTISTNPNAQFMNLMMPFNDNDKERVHSLIEQVYFRFVQKVADARGMEFDDARALAKGRVWTGERAHELGLVDVLGDMQDAINLAKRRMGVPDTMKVYVQTYPRPIDEITALLKMFGLDDNSTNDAVTDISRKELLAAVLGTKPDLVGLTLERMPAEMRRQVIYAVELMEMSARERAIAAMPEIPTIK